MNAKTPKTTLQITGTIVALIGIYYALKLCVGVGLRYWDVLLIPIAFGLYFVYLGYLTWWRFSPRAIQHISRETHF